MTFSVPSVLQAATRPFMPPNAAAEVAVAASTALPEPEELPELPLFELLLHPAANIRPLTARAAAASVAARNPCPDGTDGGIVVAGIDREVAGPWLSAPMKGGGPRGEYLE
jgi:hypothetical protein